jgi:hypothetical protein
MGNQRNSLSGFRVFRVAFAALLLGIGLLALASPVWASTVESIRVSQVFVKDPLFKAYVEILDAKDRMVRHVRPDQLTAALGSHPLMIVDVRDFSDPMNLSPDDRGVAYILLVDISKSLSSSEFAKMRLALNSWVDRMSRYDQAAIITFGTEVKVHQAFTPEIESLKDIIAKLGPTDQHTQLHAGLVRAIELGRQADPSLPARRVIITCSDGQDDYVGGMTRQEVMDQLKADPVPIYAIGFCRQPITTDKEEFLKSLGAFARTSGGAYFRAPETIQDMFRSMPDILTKMHQRIENVYQVKMTCPDCPWDGTVRHLQMTYTGGPKVLNAGLEMRIPQRESFWAELPTEAKVGGVTVISLGIPASIYLLLARRRRDRLQAEDSEQVEQFSVAEPPPQESAIPLMTIPVAEPARPGKKLRLTVVRGLGKHPPYEVSLADRLVIGRSPDCDVALTEDKEVSRRHCELTLEGSHIRIADLGSRNGTMVNGVPISGTYQLQTDDHITLGKTELRLTIV